MNNLHPDLLATENRQEAYREILNFLKERVHGGGNVRRLLILAENKFLTKDK